MDQLFPVLPEDLSTLSDEELQSKIDEHLEAQRLIRENNDDFLAGLQPMQIIEQAKEGKAQLAALRAYQDSLAEAEENFTAQIAELTSDVAESTEEGGEEGGDEGNGGDGDEAEVSLAAEVDEDEVAVEEPVEEPEVVTAAAVRRPPKPSKARAGRQLDEVDGFRPAVLTASAEVQGVMRPGDELDANDFSRALIGKAKRLGPPKKHPGGTEERYLLAAAHYDFPESRTLTSDISANAEKIRSLQNSEGKSLVASGGLCAPLTPLYTIPQFAVTSRPVRDALPSFTADRGGVNVPVPTTLSSASNAITIITEANDALGGTFATKSCLDQTCLDYVETAVTIISHCREYGNLNARAWPESVTFENELTMAEHARVSDQYLLGRIKSLSLQVTQATVLGETYDLITAITRAVSAIRYRLRASENTRFRALMPSWVPDSMVNDIASTQFDRFKSRAQVTAILREAGVEPTFYIDDVLTGTSQGFADEVNNTTLDPFPTSIQWALYIEGAFMHLDGGTLELGLVRDSSLNETNDFQMFGEGFENVVRLGPAQSALWITSAVRQTSEFPCCSDVTP